MAMPRCADFDWLTLHPVGRCYADGCIVDACDARSLYVRIRVDWATRSYMIYTTCHEHDPRHFGTSARA